jgi:hypothetical protein
MYAKQFLHSCDACAAVCGATEFERFPLWYNRCEKKLFYLSRVLIVGLLEGEILKHLISAWFPCGSVGLYITKLTANLYRFGLENS